MNYNKLVEKIVTWIPPAIISGLVKNSKRNLAGDRYIEWSWVVSQIPDGEGYALDFGSGQSPLGLMATQKGYHVTAIDLEQVSMPYEHERLKYLKVDLFNMVALYNYDLIINCSTIEHIGLVGRYGVNIHYPNGDLKAMRYLKDIMLPDATMLLTIPIGQDAIFSQMCRVYGKKRLPLLLSGYTIKKEQYWIKDDNNRWVIADKEIALNTKASAGSWNPLKNYYALGCFALRKDS
jgi:hypothetical protein